MKICVIGAYGYTGKIICAELLNAGIEFGIAGRNAGQLVQLGHLTGSNSAHAGNICDTSFTEELLHNYDLFINCAGPFTEESALFLSSIAENGKTYIDITGEIGFVRSSREQFHQKAIDSGSLILHACAFESLIAGLELQRLVGKNKQCFGVRTCYEFGQKKMSPGTRITMKLSSFRKPWCVRNGSWTLSDPWRDRHTIMTGEKRVAVPFPLPEIAFAHWDYAPNFAESLLVLSPEEAMLMGVPKVHSETAGEILQQLRMRKHDGPGEVERRAHWSKITCLMYNSLVSYVARTVKCEDMYGLTGKIVRVVVAKLRKSPHKFYGVLNPAGLFHGDEASVLSELGCRIEPEDNIQFV